jgi:ABC-type amino acid transport substrate-binding protein
VKAARLPLVLAGGALLLAAPVAHGAAPTHRPGVLVVAVSMPAPGLQVGAVKGSSVVYARGLEIDLARTVARRLGVRRVDFVQVPDHGRLLGPGRKRWDLALAQIQPTARLARTLDLSVPYLSADQAVLLARGVPRPRSLAELRKLQLCVVRRSRGADVAGARVRPVRKTLVAANDAALLRLVQTGRCDAALRETPQLAQALADGDRGAYGPVVGRIETGVAFAIALQRHSPLTAPVDRALQALRADGKLGRLARAWLGLDPARLRVLR